ncbi:MAG: lyase family protein, partial [Bacilli bacterium]|nr:lyase family protein [Bacilli bacterium]
SLRSKETYQITKHGLNRQMIKALANIKKTAAKTNSDLGYLNKEVGKDIYLACEEILNGRLHGQFITDVVQGGSGDAMNTNANEVIANRANELLGGEKGKYDLVRIEDTNLNQNSFEVVLIAGKLSIIRLTKKMLTEAKKLYNSFYDKINKYNLSRYEDFSVGQQLHSFGENLDRDIKRINTALASLLEVSISSTAIPSEQASLYLRKFMKYLVQYSGESLILTKNVLDNKQNLDNIAWVSSMLRILSADLSKAATDLKLLDQAGKIIIPDVDEAGRYVVLDMVKQVSFYITGNDLTISRSVEAGEMEENTFLPIIYACIFEMCNMIRRTMRTLREQLMENLIIVGYEKTPASE